MADFSSIFAPNPCCYLANAGGTHILLCCEGKNCGCCKKRCGGCGKKKKKCCC